MRLKWGPHRGRTPEQLVLREPAFVLQVLDRNAGGALASRFRDLIAILEARPLVTPCAGCGRAAVQVVAYPASIHLIGVCSRCALAGLAAAPGAAVIDGYEAALRHVAATFRHALRPNMRRMVDQLARARGGPQVATEDASVAFFRTAPEGGRRPSRRTTFVPIHQEQCASPRGGEAHRKPVFSLAP